MSNLNLNKVVLAGRLTADPELKQTQSGISVTSFSIAINRRFASRNSEQAEQQTDFINIVAWRQNAEFICKYFKKGNAICVCGSIQTRSYDAADGSKRYVTEVVADEATFVEKKNEKGEEYRSMPYSSDKVDDAPRFEEIAEDGDLPF